MTVKSWPALGALKDDDFLRVLVWLGPFFLNHAAPSQRSLYAYTAVIPDSRGKTPRRLGGGRLPATLGSAAVTRSEFGVGDLAALHTGMLFRRQRLVRLKRPILQELTFTADFDRQEINAISQIQGLDEKNSWLGGAWDRLGASPCVVLSGDWGRVVIPVPEVLRWCYGSSSRVLQAVLSNEIGTVIEAVMGSGRMHDGVYQMNVPADFLDSDAPLLAWLALDPAARQVAERMDLQIMAVHHGGQSHPKTRFPYGGLRQLSVQGRRIGDDLFLASLIQHVAFTPPFRGVALSTTTSTQTGQQAEAEPQRRSHQKHIRHPENHVLLSNTEPRRRGSAARLPGLVSQFSNIVPVIRTPELGEGETVTTLFTVMQPARVLTTGLGEDADSVAGRAVIAHPQPGQESPILDSLFLNLRQALAFLPPTLRIQEIAVNNPLGSEGRFNNWLKRDGERVGCLVIQIETQTTKGFLYLLEKELVRETYGPLILATRRPTGARATEAELSSLMDTRRKGRTWPREVPGWTLTHIKHGYGSPGGMAAGILKAMQLPLPPLRP